MPTQIMLSIQISKVVFVWRTVLVLFESSINFFRHAASSKGVGRMQSGAGLYNP